ncbi:MAG: SHOCT domain-containing protein [Thermodesulfobacteriota bacterium]|nr:SHOCT domain-containing protein [Thermodesulfobacteriota bacterium]
MRYLLRVTPTIMLMIVLSAVFCYAKDKAISQQKLYTAYNIWKWSGFNMKCINYKGGRSFIPAGTEISKSKVTDFCYGHDCRKIISFKTTTNNKNYKIFYTKNYHPGKTIEDYKRMMFTTKNFAELTAGLTQHEINAIKKGIIQNGMSKEAVFICYGPPPEHATPSRNGNVWLYWKNKRTTERIVFNSKGRTGPEIIRRDQKKPDTATSVEEKILLLKRLLDKGLITQEEYDKKKAALLESL